MISLTLHFTLQIERPVLLQGCLQGRQYPCKRLIFNRLKAFFYLQGSVIIFKDEVSAYNLLRMRTSN